MKRVRTIRYEPGEVDGGGGRVIGLFEQISEARMVSAFEAEIIQDFVWAVLDLTPGQVGFELTLVQRQHGPRIPDITLRLIQEA